MRFAIPALAALCAWTTTLSARAADEPPQGETAETASPAPAEPAPSPEVAPAAETAPAPEPKESVGQAQAEPVRDAPTESTPVQGGGRYPWRFGATLGVVSLPRLLSLEVLARYRKKDDPHWDLFAIGAGIEYLPPGIAAFGETTTLSWLQTGVDGRFFFFRWAFVGARLGYQFARADSEKFGSEVDYVTTSFFLAPKLGILHTFPSGLTIGGDFGATIPFGADTSISSDGTQDSNARKVAKTFGGFVMPFVSLFRVGWTI